MNESIFYECTDGKCIAGKEIYIDEGKKRKHRVSFQAPLGEFTHIKKGDMIPEKKCYKCNKKTLIRD